MSEHAAAEAPAEETRRSTKALAVSLIGPVAAGGGVVWAILQPYRVTLLDPAGESFWWLAVQPPLLVIVVGAVFHLLVAPGLVEDIASVEDEADR
jgi:hypothetical protein